MKKLLKSLVMSAIVSALTSCSGDGHNMHHRIDDGGIVNDERKNVSNADIEELLQKYEKTYELSKNEYGKLIGYFDSALGEILPLFRKYERASDNGDEVKSEEFVQQLNMLVDVKYKYLIEVSDVLSSAAEDELGKANAQKFSELIEKMNKADFGLCRKMEDIDIDVDSITDDVRNSCVVDAEF